MVSFFVYKNIIHKFEENVKKFFKLGLKILMWVNVGNKKREVSVACCRHCPNQDFLLPITSLVYFLSGRVGITHKPIHCVARGDGYYELQSKVHCSFRITYLLNCSILKSLRLTTVPTYRVRVLSNTNRAPEGVIDVELTERLPY